MMKALKFNSKAPATWLSLNMSLMVVRVVNPIVTKLSLAGTTIGIIMIADAIMQKRVKNKKQLILSNK